VIHSQISEFATASGLRRWHTCQRSVPQVQSADEPDRRRVISTTSVSKLRRVQGFKEGMPLLLHALQNDDERMDDPSGCLLLC
jgi:hypothetical protein